MHVARIGFTPLKGGRHTQQDAVDLAPEGPVGDRVFCLVDPARARVLRTVENPALVTTAARWADGTLTVTLPSGVVSGSPTPTGQVLDADYWGRSAKVEVVDGPWAHEYSRLLGRDVVLARSVAPGEVVYGASVSLVTTSSLALLSARAGVTVDPARFRATFVVDTGDLPAHVEDSWVGGSLTVGGATLRVNAVIPRCAVVDGDPDTGDRAVPVLATLAGYRRRDGEVDFGVDAVVTRPGRVAPGDPVTTERD